MLSANHSGDTFKVSLATSSVETPNPKSPFVEAPSYKVFRAMQLSESTNESAVAKLFPLEDTYSTSRQSSQELLDCEKDGIPK